MALSLAKIRIYSDLISTEKNYDFDLENKTILDLKRLAKKLDLVNLKHIDCLQNMIFKDSQCAEILKNEIPALLSENSSEKLHKALKDLEFALKDITSPFTYLMFKND